MKRLLFHILPILIIVFSTALFARADSARPGDADSESIETNKEEPARNESERNDADINKNDDKKEIIEEKTEKETERKIEEQKDKDTSDREQAEKEKADKEKAEKEKADKERKLMMDAQKAALKEYIALIFGYGGAFPVAAYGSRYSPSHRFSGTVGIYALNLYGLSPELHVRYAKLDSKRDPMRYGSSLTMLDMFPAIVYRHAFTLPRNTLTVYGRIFDGVSRVGYTSTNPYFPYNKEKIVEYINIFGFSAGCYYDVWKGLLLGVDVGYSLIFTAGKPLQSVSVGMNVGWRIL